MRIVTVTAWPEHGLDGVIFDPSAGPLTIMIYIVKCSVHTSLHTRRGIYSVIVARNIT